MAATAGLLTKPTKVRKIITRLVPNLECGFFAALLEIDRIRQHLGITRGELKWEFISVAIREKPKAIDPAYYQKLLERYGIVYFNVGGANYAGTYDQHGRQENASLCQICSLDLVRGRYDFLEHRPWLKEIYQRVRQNDIDGTKISKHKLHLRELVTGLTANYLTQPQLILDFTKLAFGGVFELCKAGYEVENAFDPAEIKKGVAQFAPGQADWFSNLVDEVTKTLETEFMRAKRAVRKAQELGKKKTVIKSDLPRDLPFQEWRVIQVLSDSIKAAQAARYFEYDLVMVCQPANSPRQSGHYQISSSTQYQYGGRDSKILVAKWRLDLGAVAAKLRLLEANFSRPQRRLEGRREDWASSGTVFYTDGLASPWYVPEFRSAVYDGSQSSPDVPKSVINHDRIFRAIIEALPQCDLLRQLPGEKDWHHVRKVGDEWQVVD